jgi:hypothetical protein
LVAKEEAMEAFDQFNPEEAGLDSMAEAARLLGEQERLIHERFGDRKREQMGEEERQEYDEIIAFYERKSPSLRLSLRRSLWKNQCESRRRSRPR